MTQLMKAAIVREFKSPLTLERVPIPDPGPGEMLVKVMACGVCHTDLHAADGDWPIKPKLPFIPGHEIAGVVVALGPGVKDFAIGDAVGVPWLHDACLSCEYCESGWESLCEHQHNTGYSCNGGFAEYVVANAVFGAHLPRGVNFAAIAPILCAGVTSYKGIKETEVRAGEWIVISGVGGLGHLAIQYAKAMGLHVAAVDIASDKLGLAKRSGADLVVDGRAPDATSQLLARTSGGAHGALVTATSPDAFSQALSLVRRKGTVCLVGLPPGNFDTPIFDVVLKRITIRGSIVGTRRDLDEAIAFAAEGKVHADVSAAPLGDINRIFDAMRRGRLEGRIVVQPHADAGQSTADLYAA